MTVQDIRAYNREAWNRQVARGNRWTVPVDAQTVARARRGDWSVVLTPTRPVPRGWFPPLSGVKLLGLASGGGQQMPIFAAAGAEVTCFDNSPAQLARDREVAEREGLHLRTVEGDMRDLSAFPDGAFDLIFHPCSNAFVPEIRPVWREAFRVLRPGGVLLAGFTQPVGFSLDPELAKTGDFRLRFPIPYSDLTSVTPEERLRFFGPDEPLEFGHTLEDQLGGQLDAGFHLTGMFEDREPESPIGKLLALFMATRALKPG